jgi:hypothetical protein
LERVYDRSGIVFLPPISGIPFVQVKTEPRFANGFLPNPCDAGDKSGPEARRSGALCASGRGADGIAERYPVSENILSEGDISKIGQTHIPFVDRSNRRFT